MVLMWRGYKLAFLAFSGPMCGSAAVTQHFVKGLLLRADMAEKGLRVYSTSEHSCRGREPGWDHFLGRYEPCLFP